MSYSHLATVAWGMDHDAHVEGAYFRWRQHVADFAAELLPPVVFDIWAHDSPHCLVGHTLNVQPPGDGIYHLIWLTQACGYDFPTFIRGALDRWFGVDSLEEFTQRTESLGPSYRAGYAARPPLPNQLLDQALDWLAPEFQDHYRTRRLLSALEWGPFG